MKIRLSLASAALWTVAFAAAAAAAAQPSAAAAAAPALTVQKVAEGVWMAEAEQGANVGWFVVSDEVVVVDSGNDAATARAVLAKIAETAGKPVKFVIVTHAHGDHAGGVPVFAAAGAQILCHENSAAALSYVLSGGKSGATAGVVGISDRLVFFGGSRRAAVYYLGAGHTNADLIVLLPEEKILFSGDLVVNGRLPYLQAADADPRGWEQILIRLASLDVEKVVPGHGKVGTRQSVGDSLAYLRKINELSTLFLQTRVPDDLYEMKLREPENRITNVIVGPDHIANVRAAVKLERARLEKAAATPTPAPKVTSGRPPAKKKS